MTKALEALVVFIIARCTSTSQKSIPSSSICDSGVTVAQEVVNFQVRVRIPTITSTSRGRKTRRDNMKQTSENTRGIDFSHSKVAQGIHCY